MRQICKYLTVLFVTFSISFNAFAADEIFYIGFNAFSSEDRQQSSDNFDGYIKDLMPIMERYEMTLGVYDVLNGGSEDIPADVVTFGTVKNMEIFQSFFQDPELLKIMPILEKSLDGHHVVFTSSEVIPRSTQTKKPSTNTLLTLYWLLDETEESNNKIIELTGNSNSVFEKYGVKVIADSAGVMSSKGLGEEVIATIPPHKVDLWEFVDAHGFFDDPLVQKNETQAKKYVNRSENYWLSERNIK